MRNNNKKEIVKEFGNNLFKIFPKTEALLNIIDLITGTHNIFMYEKLSRFILSPHDDEFKNINFSEDLIFTVLNVIQNITTLEKIDILRKISIYYTNENLLKNDYIRIINIIDKINHINDLDLLNDYNNEHGNYVIGNSEILSSHGLIYPNFNNNTNGTYNYHLTDLGKILLDIINN